MLKKATAGTTLVLSMLCFSAYSAEITPPPTAATAASETLFREKFDAGEYWSVGSEGLDYLKENPGNNELRMLVADSLSWTGRYEAAIIQYQMLSGTSLADRAAVGLANVYRWSGRPDLAAPLYQKVLKSQPDNPDAVDGQNRVNRELRPGTEITFDKKSDSNTVVNHSTEITHHWRSDNLALKYELSLNTNRYSLAPSNTRQQEVNLSIEHDSMAMAPRLDLSVQQGPITNAFALLRLKLSDAPELHVSIGHVNWGNMVYQPLAVVAGLSANQLGADGHGTRLRV